MRADIRSQHRQSQSANSYSNRIGRLDGVLEQTPQTIFDALGRLRLLAKGSKMEKRCILTGCLINSENNSAAHVIPSALGGRLKPKAILSATGNQILNVKVDTPLVRSLYPLMALLGGSRDNGKNIPVKMTSEGTSYLVHWGQPIQLEHPDYRESPNEQGVNIEIRARTMKEVQQLLGRVKAKYPDFDVNTALTAAKMQENYLPDMLQGKLQLGPNPIFPAVFAMANVYAASLEMPLHAEFQNYIHGLPERTKFEKEGTEIAVPMPLDTFYWIPKICPVIRPEGITHIVTYFGDPRRKQALFYAELFNLPGIAVVLPYTLDTTTIRSYAVNVVTGIEQHVEHNPLAFQEPWLSTHQVGELFETVKQCVGDILGFAAKRTREHEVTRIFSKVAGDSLIFTEDHAKELSSRLSQFAASMLLRSGIPPNQ
jgi:hypothetical protein